MSWTDHRAAGAARQDGKLRCHFCGTRHSPDDLRPMQDPILKRGSHPACAGCRQEMGATQEPS